MPTYDYATLESLLRQILELTQPPLTRTHAQETLDYLDVGEYGLAFESLVGAMVDANVRLTGAMCSLIKDAAHQMNYSEDLSGMGNREVAAAFALVWEACRDCAE